MLLCVKQMRINICYKEEWPFDEYGVFQGKSSAQIKKFQNVFPVNHYRYKHATRSQDSETHSNAG